MANPRKLFCVFCLGLITGIEYSYSESTDSNLSWKIAIDPPKIELLNKLYNRYKSLSIVKLSDKSGNSEKTLEVTVKNIKADAVTNHNSSPKPLSDEFVDTVTLKTDFVPFSTVPQSSSSKIISNLSLSTVTHAIATATDTSSEANTDTSSDAKTEIFSNNSISSSQSADTSTKNTEEKEATAIKSTESPTTDISGQTEENSTDITPPTILTNKQTEEQGKTAATEKQTSTISESSSPRTISSTESSSVVVSSESSIANKEVSPSSSSVFNSVETAPVFQTTVSTSSVFSDISSTETETTNITSGPTQVTDSDSTTADTSSSILLSSQSTEGEIVSTVSSSVETSTVFSTTVSVSSVSSDSSSTGTESTEITDSDSTTADTSPSTMPSSQSSTEGEIVSTVPTQSPSSESDFTDSSAPSEYSTLSTERTTFDVTTENPIAGKSKGNSVKIAVSVTFLFVALLGAAAMIVYIIRTKKTTIQYDELTLLP